MAVALLPAVVVASGCFDVHTVDPGPYVIDDFDDGDIFPADTNFDRWECGSYSPSTNQNYSCGLDHDTLDGSAFSMRLDFTIADVADGKMQQGGVVLDTSVTKLGGPEDFSRFSEIGFDAKLESGTLQLPSSATLYVQLGCSTALLDDGSEPGDLDVVRSLDYQDYWQPFHEALTNFTPPSYETRQIRGGVAACLARVDNITFSVDAGLSDGQMGSGILHIDDVYLQ